MKKCENPLILEITKTYKKRIINLSSIKLPEGLKKKCVWCLKDLTGRQQRWCGQECLNAACAWASPQKEEGLGFLLIKQNFKCNICQFDYGQIVEEIYKRNKVPYGVASTKDTWRTEFSYWLMRHLKNHMRVYDAGHRLEVDHIVPIYKGGQSIGLENVQCICYNCHKTKTKIDNSGKRKKNDIPNTDDTEQ